MNGLTNRQRECLAAVANAIGRGLPPTVREIGTAMGIRSTNGVRDHLIALERKGYLVREELKSRGLRLTRSGWSAAGVRPVGASPVIPDRGDGEPASFTLMAASGSALEMLQRRPRTKSEISAALGVSEMTVQRALTWLRECDVPLFFDRSTMRWSVGNVPDLLEASLSDLVSASVLGHGEATALALLMQCGQRRQA